MGLFQFEGYVLSLLSGQGYRPYTHSWRPWLLTSSSLSGTTPCGPLHKTLSQFPQRRDIRSLPEFHPGGEATLSMMLSWYRQCMVWIDEFHSSPLITQRLFSASGIGEPLQFTTFGELRGS